MKMTHARQVLIDACCRDFCPDGLDVGRNGFRGFANLSDAELIQAATDAELQEENDTVQEATETLSRLGERASSHASHHLVSLDAAEFDFILAAINVYQQTLFCPRAIAIDAEVLDLASNGGEHEPLNTLEIDALAERLYGSFADPLVKIREYDARMHEGDDPQAPTGDDYNEVLSILGIRG